MLAQQEIERMHKAHAPAAAVVPLGNRKATHRKSKSA